MTGTRQTLLEKARNWADQQTWNEMIRLYSPMLERWSHRWLENRDDAAELHQRIWLEVAQRIQTFRYDSGRSFRSWLKTLHRSRVHDFLKHQTRQRRRMQAAARSLPADDSYEITLNPTTLTESSDATRLEPLLDRMRQVQARVQARVQPRSWQIFWSIAVDGLTIKETSLAQGMTYAATFAAFSRVEKMLRQEAMKE
ncbi:MAG: hypothetical protein RJA81_2059 [Planctomycetota bacterium]|jgi:RNA polymerase sigma factor (sigma-70 family)